MNEIRKRAQRRQPKLLPGILLFTLPAATLHAAQTDDAVSVDAVSVEVVPQLRSYVDIDRALTSEVIEPVGGVWRFVPATAEPSTKLEWTKAGFDESTWSNGPAPFYYGVESSGTEVPELADSVVGVYMRSVLNLDELKRYERIVLELPTNDGFIFYFNGTGTKFRNAGEPAHTPAFDFAATSARTLATVPIPVADLTRTIRSGANQLAIHALIHADDERTFAISPTLRGTLRRSATFDDERSNFLRGLLQPADDAPPSPLATYLEGRCAQRAGDHASGALHFEDTVALDPSSELGWSRLVECRRALGTLAALDAECRAVFGPDTTPEMLEAWTGVCLNDLGHTPGDLAAALPVDLELAAGTLVSDTRWLAEQLAAGRPIRLDCGREREHQGNEWSRDRFFSPASVKRTTQSDGTTSRTLDVGRSIRLNTREPGDLTPAYRIPLPSGAYELRLTFVGNDGDECAPGDAAFDVVLEGARILRNYDPVVEAGKRGRAVHSYPIWIADGFLDLDLRTQTDLDPWIAGLEIRPLDTTAYHEHAAAWVSALEHPTAFPLVQAAEALWRSGDTHGALAVFERAESMTGFLTEHAERLGTLRLELLPELAGFASADDLAQRYPRESEAQLDAIHAAAGGESELGTYLAGRLHQRAGRLDEALGSFEMLLETDSADLRPLLRMAQCLVGAGLPEHAADMVSDAVSGAEEVPSELLSLWISLNLTSLGREPWEVIADLEQMGAPETLVVMATSEDVPRPWHVSLAEPPSTSWCRTTFDASAWPLAMGALGTGHTFGSSTRTPWSTDSIYARRTFDLSSVAMLYPHVTLNVTDAANVYINGTSTAFVGITSEAYITMPARKNDWIEGQNVIGVHAFNSIGAGTADAGIVQPLGDLMWVERELRTKGILRLNCGGPEHTTADGIVWSRDRFFGWAKSISMPAEMERPDIEGTVDDTLYTSMRYFHDDVTTTWYQVPVPNGPYRVRLHFAEIDPTKTAGERIFNVTLEQYIVLPDHDIAAGVGMAHADVHSFDIEVTDDWLDLRLFHTEGYGTLCALEIEQIVE
ncbi:MAG: hypothetical protein ACI8QZ_002284 [Chlamydiales bacterium]